MSSDAGNFGHPFPTTQWSEVARAAHPDPQVKRQAIANLLTAYLPALRAHLLSRRHTPDRVDDLLQGFVCDQVVADDLIAQADKERGRFRSFVLVALNHYVASSHRYDNAQKRKPGQPVLDIDAKEVCSASSGAADPFDLAWARRLVEQAIAQMRAQCTGGREHVWTIFESCTLAPLLRNEAAPPLSDLAARFGLTSAQQVSNTLVTAKRMFARALRKIVGEYAPDEQAIEEELRDLLAILSTGGPSSSTTTAG
jgi:RNA polymerase sigma-70 factor (ECF subfamily)